MVKTLYIDVYFMINFTVDMLAVFIAARFTHLKINIKRLILSGIAGGTLASVEIFLNEKFAHIGLAVIFLFILLLLCCKNTSFQRKLKFLFSFYISAFLISGIVNFIYGLLDRYLDASLIDGSTPANRKAVVFSLIILLIIGVLRLFLMMFSDAVNEKNVRIFIELEGKNLEADALVDTGNLVKDPMNLNPVIFLKRELAEKIIPCALIDLSDIDSLGARFRKRIRLIPVTRNSQTHVMTGVTVDRVLLIRDKYKEEINATIAIDKEDGTFGGYYALVPYVAACDNV